MYVMVDVKKIKDKKNVQNFNSILFQTSRSMGVQIISVDPSKFYFRLYTSYKI